MNRRKTMKLQTMMILLVIAVVFISIAIIIPFVASWMTRNIENEAKTNVMNVAELVAHSNEVVDALEQKNTSVISSYVTMQLKNLELVDYIIVADNQGVRYSHPNPQMIGKTFEGGDEDRVVRLGRPMYQRLPELWEDPCAPLPRSIMIRIRKLVLSPLAH